MNVYFRLFIILHLFSLEDNVSPTVHTVPVSLSYNQQMLEEKYQDPKE